MELQLNNEEALALIECIKHVLKKHELHTEPDTKGKIKLKSYDGNEFILHYFFKIGKVQINLMDHKTKSTLIRINSDNNFHKNADGTRVTGARVNIFDEDEYYAKNDGATHYKCHPLPFKGIKRSSDFMILFEDLIKYAHIESNDFLSFHSTLNV